MWGSMVIQAITISIILSLSQARKIAIDISRLELLALCLLHYTQLIRLNVDVGQALTISCLSISYNGRGGM